MRILTGKTILLLTAFCILCAGSAYAQKGEYVTDERVYAKARIVKIEETQVERSQGILLSETRIQLEILDGEMKGMKKTAIFGGESDLPEEMRYRVGDTVFVGIARNSSANTTEYVSIYDMDNTAGIIILVTLLVIAVVLIGRLKGAASLLALIITILLLFLVLIPLTLRGFPPLPIAVGISFISIIITLPIIAGFKLKTLAAVMGAAGGILVASVLALASGYLMHLSGIVTNDMLTVFYASDVNIDIRGLVLSGMIIAALGAIMDICISISSSAAEIFRANPLIPERDALKSVLTVGTDILGSMVNTLILAYVGSSLSLILWITMRLQPGMSFWMVLNYNPVLSEIVKSVIGSLGMFASIPLTALFAVKLYRAKPGRKIT